MLVAFLREFLYHSGHLGHRMAFFFYHTLILGNLYQPFTPWNQFAYSLYCSLYISWNADKENLFNNQEIYKLVIISFILMTLMFDSGVIL